MLCLVCLKYEMLDTAVFFNNDIVFVNIDSGNGTSFTNDMSLIIVDLINVSLDDYNCDDDHHETIIAQNIRFAINDFLSKYD